VPREQATVGALRRSVEGHDVAVRARSRRGAKSQAERAAAFNDAMLRMGQDESAPAQR
jgi:hypothetical protein